MFIALKGDLRPCDSVERTNFRFVDVIKLVIACALEICIV